jgi:hypothetical protein
MWEDIKPEEISEAIFKVFKGNSLLLNEGTETESSVWSRIAVEVRKHLLHKIDRFWLKIRESLFNVYEHLCNPTFGFHGIHIQLCNHSGIRVDREILVKDSSVEIQKYFYLSSFEIRLLFS